MRAHHILLSPQLGLAIMYNQNLSPTGIKVVCEALAKIHGVTSIPLEKPPGATGTVFLLNVDSASTEEAMKAVKQLVDPELPVTIGRLEFNLHPCAGGGYEAPPVFDFVKGLQPDDYATFNTQAHAALATIPVQDLLPTPSSDQKPLRRAIQTALQQAGAWAHSIQINVHQPRPWSIN